MRGNVVRALLGVTRPRSLRRAAALAAAGACVLLPLLATTASASIDDLGATPEMCNAYAPKPLCFYPAVSGTDTFNLGGHILFRGDTVSGVYKWSIGGQGGGEYPAIGSVAVRAAGPGLDLIHCKGKLADSNAKARWRTVRAFDVTEGHTTCTWKATKATDAWVNGPGLDVGTAGGTYTAGDFYAVLSKGGAIEGHVREQNVTRDLPDFTGIPGAKVRISGPKGYRKTVSTSDTGYYKVIVARPGRYTVTPSAPKAYFKGGKARKATPDSDDVTVRDGETSTSDFTYRSTLRLRVKLDKASVPADGQSFVTATITSTDAGEPDPNQKFSLRPFGGGSALQSPYELKVPATICSVNGTATNGRVWPDPKATTPNTNSVDLATDSTGQLTLRVYTGTVSGTFPLTVWAQDNAGNLIHKNSTDVSDDAGVNVTKTAGAGDPAITLHDWLNQPGNETLAGTLTPRPDSLAQPLVQAMAGGTLRSFVVTPVQTKQFKGVLLSPADTRVGFDPKTGTIDPASPGGLIAPDGLIGLNGFGGGYWGYVKSPGPGGIAAFPTLGQWLAGSAPGYTFAGNAGPVTLYNSTGLQYAGFGYGPLCT
jgi:hypothetical protein